MASINTLIYENRAGSNVATLDQRPAPPAVEPSIMVSSPVPTTGMTTDPADPPKSDRTLVADEINRSHGSRYRGIIQNAQHARSVQSAYTKHIQSRQVTVDNDETYPTTTKQELRYVERMYYSIVDMRESWEVQKARLKKDKLDGARERTGQTPSLAENGPVERQGNKRKRAGGNGDEEDGDDDQPRSKRNKTTDLTGAESKLVSDNFDPAAQLEACLSYSLSDLEVEMLAWTLLVSHTCRAFQTLMTTETLPDKLTLILTCIGLGKDGTERAFDEAPLERLASHAVAAVRELRGPMG